MLAHLPTYGCKPPRVDNAEDIDIMSVETNHISPEEWVGDLDVSFLTTTFPLAVARSLRSSVSHSGSYAVAAHILPLRIMLTFVGTFPVP